MSVQPLVSSKEIAAWQDDPSQVTEWIRLLELRQRRKETNSAVPWRLDSPLEAALVNVMWSLSWGIPSKPLNPEQCTIIWEDVYAFPDTDETDDTETKQSTDSRPAKRPRHVARKESQSPPSTDMDEDSDSSSSSPSSSSSSGEDSDDDPILIDRQPVLVGRRMVCIYPGRLQLRPVVDARDKHTFHLRHTKTLEEWTRIYLEGPDSQWPFGFKVGPLLPPDPDWPPMLRMLARNRRRLPSFFKFVYTEIPCDGVLHRKWVRSECDWYQAVFHRMDQEQLVRLMPKDWTIRPSHWAAPRLHDSKTIRRDIPSKEELVAWVPFEFGLGVYSPAQHKPYWEFRDGRVLLRAKHFAVAVASYYIQRRMHLGELATDALMQHVGRVRQFQQPSFFLHIVPWWIQRHSRLPPPPPKPTIAIPFHPDTLPPCIWVMLKQSKHLDYVARTAFVGYMAKLTDPATNQRLSFDKILCMFKERARARFGVMDFPREWSKIASDAKAVHTKAIGYSCRSMREQGMCVWRGVKDSPPELKEYPVRDIEDLIRTQDTHTPTEMCGRLCGGLIETPLHVGKLLEDRRVASRVVP